MAIKHNALSSSILENIDDHLASVIGPMAVIICEQCIEHWVEVYMPTKKTYDLRAIPHYVELICEELDDDDKRQFLSDLKSDKMVAIYLR
jgi:hypothetical protein